MTEDGWSGRLLHGINTEMCHKRDLRAT